MAERKPFLLRIDSVVLDAVQRWANDDLRSLNAQIEFVLRDAIGRDWQCGTLQVDYVLPERLDATYIGSDGQKHRPVMLHRAILGSLERFIGILVENYAGRLPLWLAPVQVVVATVTNEADAYAEEVAEALRAAGLRADADLSADKISYKVRQHSLAKVPLIMAVGGRESAERQDVRSPRPSPHRWPGVDARCAARALRSGWRGVLPAGRRR